MGWRAMKCAHLLLCLSLLCPPLLLQVYRANYKSRCMCVSWSQPLKTLQMVAVCLHAAGGVHALCRLMCTDYRQFSSGQWCYHDVCALVIVACRDLLCKTNCCTDDCIILLHQRLQALLTCS
jgi:hypothetical protein